MEANNKHSIEHFFTRVKRRLRREVRQYIIFPRALKSFIRWSNRVFITPKDLGGCGKNVKLETPTFIENPKGVFMEDYSRIRKHCAIICAPGEKVIIKKFTGIAPSVTIITDNHYKTVGIPHFFLSPSHINDTSGNVVIEEDVWVGTNSIIMPGVTIGRGAIVGAGSLVTKNVPPYALVVGRPAKVVSKVFSLEDVFRHEEIIYPPEERLSHEYLTELFETTYKDLKVYGVNAPLTDEQQTHLNKIMKRYNYGCYGINLVLEGGGRNRHSILIVVYATSSFSLLLVPQFDIFIYFPINNIVCLLGSKNILLQC